MFIYRKENFHSKKIKHFIKNKKIIIIGESSLISKTLGTETNNFIKAYYNLIKKIKAEFPNYNIILANCGGTNALNYLSKMTNLPLISADNFSYVDYISLLKSSALHISGRHHSTCYSIIANCPFIGFSANTHKIQGDIELIDWPYPVLDFYNMNFEIDKLLSFSKEILNSQEYYQEFLEKKHYKLNKLLTNGKYFIY